MTEYYLKNNKGYYNHISLSTNEQNLYANYCNLANSDDYVDSFVVNGSSITYLGNVRHKESGKFFGEITDGYGFVLFNDEDNDSTVYLCKLSKDSNGCITAFEQVQQVSSGVQKFKYAF